jgi:preprotein translocase subunit Sec63
VSREQLRQQREDAHFYGPEWQTLGQVSVSVPRWIDEATAAVLILVAIVLAIFGGGVALGKWWRS